jgi:uncharacterized membrane protein YiaA
MNPLPQKPSAAFVGASWLALGLGMLAYMVGLMNSAMPLVERGYYFICLMFGLFAAVSLQKSVRDRLENVPVTAIYFGLAWVALTLAVLLTAIGLWNSDLDLASKGFYAMSLTAIGLWNSDLDLASKGFYAMSYVLSLFAAVAVQKNVRDISAADAGAGVPAWQANQERQPVLGRKPESSSDS